MKFRTLKANEIDCRINTINEKGLTLLLYKDARVDQNILDETVGSMNWQRKHTRDNANCIVSIWDSNKGQWIEKEDTGTESFSEAEKGLASDSFKRACFNWGIGRELYSAPFIWIDIKGAKIEKKNDKWTCYDKFKVEEIEYNENNEITKLIINNVSKRMNVFEYDINKIIKKPSAKDISVKIKKLINEKDILPNEISEHFGKTSNEMTPEELEEVIAWLEAK